MSEGSYTLYGRPGSGSDVLQMLLEEIGAPYDFVTIGKNLDVAAYSKLALTDKVPALTLPSGTTMFESAAIALHLAAAHPAARLAPAPGTVEHARLLQWMVYLSANLYECVRRIYYPARYSRQGEAAADDIRAKATEDFGEILALIVPSLSPYVLGKSVSAVDYYLHMVAGWLPEGRDPVTARWPALERHAALMRERAAVRKVEAAAST